MSYDEESARAYFTRLGEQLATVRADDALTADFGERRRRRHRISAGLSVLGIAVVAASVVTGLSAASGGAQVGAAAGAQPSLSGGTSLVTSGPCQGLSVKIVSGVTNAAGDTLPSEAGLDLRPGDANSIAMDDKPLLFIRVSGPCQDMVRYTESGAVASASGGSPTYFFNGLGWIYAVGRGTGHVDFDLQCPDGSQCGLISQVTVSVGPSVIITKGAAPTGPLPMISAVPSASPSPS